MKIYSLEQDKMEEFLDGVKVAIMEALMNQGVFEEEFADEWCKNHTVILRKKSLFRALLKRKKEEDVKGERILVVKRITRS